MDDMTTTTLEQDVIEALAAGQTRSVLELVTELAVPYEDVSRAVEHLRSAELLRVDYKSENEVFYKQAPGAAQRLHSSEVEPSAVVAGPVASAH